jgi:hypothetical protein
MAGCEAIRMANCTHHSGAKRVLEAEVKERTVNLSKMVMGIFGCVLIFRRQHPKNKTQLKGEIGLFGGVVKSVLGQDQIICLAVPELYGHTSREHYLAPKSAAVMCPFNNDPLQILMQWGGVFPDYFTHLRAGGGMMREFTRGLDDDGRTSQHPTTLKLDDRNIGYFEETKQMVLRFDQNEAQLDQPPEAREAEPAEIRPSEEDQAQEERRSIAENLLQRERRRASPSAAPVASKRVHWKGDDHDPKAVILKPNDDKLKKVRAQYQALPAHAD